MKPYKKPATLSVALQPLNFLALSDELEGNNVKGNGSILTRGEQGNPRKTIWGED